MVSKQPKTFTSAIQHLLHSCSWKISMTFASAAARHHAGMASASLTMLPTAARAEGPRTFIRSPELRQRLLFLSPRSNPWREASNRSCTCSKRPANPIKVMAGAIADSTLQTTRGPMDLASYVCANAPAGDVHDPTPPSTS